MTIALWYGLKFGKQGLFLILLKIFLALFHIFSSPLDLTNPILIFCKKSCWDYISEALYLPSYG